MATATERWSDRRLTKSADGWTAARAWDVIAATSETDAIAASGIPAINASHPLNGYMKVRALPVERIGFNMYVVRAEYGYPPDGTEWPGPGTESDPLDEPISIQWEAEEVIEPIDRDVNGAPITNSAGDAFAEPVQRSFTLVRFSIYRNEPFFDAAEALLWANTTNSDNWTVPGVGMLLAGQAKCRFVTPTDSYRVDANYVKVRYAFEARKERFTTRLLDQGFRAWYKDSTDNDTRKPGEIFDAAGNRVTSPVRLNGNGTLLASASETYLVGDSLHQFETTSNPNWTPQALGESYPCEIETADYAVYLRYTIYEARDFDDFNFQ